MQSHTGSGWNRPSFTHSKTIYQVPTVGQAQFWGLEFYSERNRWVTCARSRSLHCSVWRTVIHNERRLNSSESQGETKAGKVGRMRGGWQGAAVLNQVVGKPSWTLLPFRPGNNFHGSLDPAFSCEEGVLPAPRLPPLSSLPTFAFWSSLSCFTSWETGRGSCCECSPTRPNNQF